MKVMTYAKIGLLGTAFFIAIGLAWLRDNKSAKISQGLVDHGIPSDCQLRLEGDDRNVEEFQVGEARAIEGTLLNVGTTVINIKKILISDCGCEGGTVNPSILGPGKTTRCVFTPKTSGLKDGIATSNFIASTADGKFIPICGSLRYVVSRSVAFSPEAIDLGPVRPNGRFERHVQLTISSNEPAPEVIAFSTNRSIVGIVGAPIRNNNGFSYDIAVSGLASANAGYYKDELRVVLKAFNGRNREFPIEILGDVHENLELSPDSLFLGYISDQTQILKKVLVKFPVGDDIKVVEVSGLSWAKVEYSETRGEGQIALLIKISPTGTVPTGNDSLKIKVVDSGTPSMLEVPCVSVSR